MSWKAEARRCIMGRTGSKIGKRLDDNHGLDESTRGKVERLDGVLTVPDVRADDAERFEDGEEDIRLDVRVGRKADRDERAMRAKVLERVVVCCTASRGDDGGLCRGRWCEYT